MTMKPNEFVQISMKEGRSLLQAVQDNPDDVPTKLVAADWFEERGADNIGFCLRWMAKHKKHPFFRVRYKDGRSVTEKFQWGWYRLRSDRLMYPDMSYREDPVPPISACLPSVVFSAIGGGHHKFSETWHEAFKCLTVALSKMRRELEI